MAFAFAKPPNSMLGSADDRKKKIEDFGSRCMQGRTDLESQVTANADVRKF